MAFFQNVFNTEFIGNLLLGDRHHIPSFKISSNVGREPERVFSTNYKFYNLSGNDGDGNPKNILNIKFSLDLLYIKAWHNLAITISANDLSKVSKDEIISSLENNEGFTSNFESSIENNKIVIKQKKQVDKFKFYIDNIGAETEIKFNKFATVAELPSYFARHTVDNLMNFNDCVGILILLDTTSIVDQNVINNAIDSKSKSLNYNYNNEKEDWQLLEGKSGIFNFTKNIFDEENRIIETIEYPCGATAGYFARKKIYKYEDGITTPYNIFEIPYVLKTEDLIEP
jgi:hypothetical protein